jgi:hypothetical protein
MTPKRPTELVRASQAVSEGWQNYNLAIDAGATHMTLKEYAKVITILQERYNSLYRQWQILGGTSDIKSIAFPIDSELLYRLADDEDNRRTMHEAAM